MKKLMLLVLLLYASVSSVWGQTGLELKKDDSSCYYEQVVRIGGVRKGVLFVRARDWMLANMNANNDMLADSAGSYIVTSAVVKIDPKAFPDTGIYQGTMRFQCHIWLQEGRYRLRIDGLTCHLLEGTDKAKFTSVRIYEELKDNDRGKYLKAQAKTKLSDIVVALEEGMKQSTRLKDKEWKNNYR